MPAVWQRISWCVLDMDRKSLMLLERKLLPRNVQERRLVETVWKHFLGCDIDVFIVITEIKKPMLFRLNFIKK